MWVENSENLKSRTNVNNLKMKNLKVISIGFVLMFFVFALNGQTEKGNVLLGGEAKLNFTFQQIDDHEKNTFGEFSPQIGIFVADGLALGVELPISYLSSNREASIDEIGIKYRSTLFAVTPFLRYYFGKSHIRPYLHGKAGLGSRETEITFEPFQISNLISPPVYVRGSYRVFLYEIGGGLGIFLNDKISLDFGVGFTSQSIIPDEDTNSNNSSITSGLGFGIGILASLGS